MTYTRSITSLNGIWNFCFVEETALTSTLPDFDLISVKYDTVEAVPGAFDATRERIGKRGIGIYRRTFTLTTSGRHEITCGGFLLAARIVIDGKDVASTVLPFTKERFEVTLESGKHEIIIACDNRFDATPMWNPNYDFYAFGGIIRDIEIMNIPDGAVNRAIVKPLNLDGNIALTILFDKTVPNGNKKITISIDEAEASEYIVSVKDCKATLNLRVSNPTLWTPETPNLHTITVATDTSAVTESFGIRIVSVQNGRICLNGKQIKLLGYNRHESDGDVGPALGAQQHIRDLQILKEMGCNFIRGSHYPQHQGFLDLCDQMGFLVWEESLGWNNVNEQLSDPTFISCQIEATRKMVEESINHPSVIIWGFLNECGSDSEPARPLIKSLVDTIKSIDDTRLTTYASNREERDICFDLVDIISVNAYPGWYCGDLGGPWPLQFVKPYNDRLIELSNKFADKSYIISEMGGAALYGCHDVMGSQWTEEYQADLLEQICTYVVNNERISGLALWMFADTRTYICGQNKPRGHNNKGTFNEYRRPKMSYRIVKKIFKNA